MFYNALGYAVELGHLASNPVDRIQWTTPAVAASVEAAALYDSAICGVDLLFESGTMRSHVLEVNAFGDFFPNLTDDRGRSVHRVEIEETARRLWG